MINQSEITLGQTKLFDTTFIIHRQIDFQRIIIHLTKNILNMTGSIEIIEPEPIQEDVSSYICMWTKNIDSRKGVISLFNTNIKLLERIVKEKLNKVLILEDDAELLFHEMELDQDCWIHFLNIRTWKNRYISTLANYYPKWETTLLLLNKLKEYIKLKKNRHRAWDLELDYMKNKFKLPFKYTNYFNHPDNISLLGNNKYHKH